MKPRKFNKALTLTEVMISTGVIMIVVIGVMNFQYYCALDARRADVRISAGRLGLLLLEGWKADGVDITAFDPAQFDSIDVKVDITNEIVPAGGLENVLGNPRITFNGVDYFVKLTYDENQPQMLEVIVAWNRDDYKPDNNTGLGDHPQSIVLTGYAIY